MAMMVMTVVVMTVLMVGAHRPGFQMQGPE